MHGGVKIRQNTVIFFHSMVYCHLVAGLPILCWKCAESKHTFLVFIFCKHNHLRNVREVDHKWMMFIWAFLKLQSDLVPFRQTISPLCVQAVFLNHNLYIDCLTDVIPSFLSLKMKVQFSDIFFLQHLNYIFNVFCIWFWKKPNSSNQNLWNHWSKFSRNFDVTKE